MPTWLAPFFSSLISAGVAFAILYINHLRDKNKAEQGDEKTWRAARMAEEKRIDEKITAETQARVKWELENAGDLARIVEILKEVGQTQQLLATVAADSKHNTSDIANLTERLNALTNHINQFILSHVGKSA